MSGAAGTASATASSGGQPGGGQCTSSSAAATAAANTGLRLFVVCGRKVQEPVLRQAFEAYGAVENFKVIRDKGVAYVRYDSTDNAKAAMEALDGVCLPDDTATTLKVMVADERIAPPPPPPPPPLHPLHHAYGGAEGGIRGGRDTSGETVGDATVDPDNVPPRSRLFVVCPRNADALKIEEAAKQMEDMEYCKTDLIAAKGVLFIKFSRMSSAMRALEDITSTGLLAGYQVKCMIAEPKGKRDRDHSAEVPSPAHQAARLDYGMNSMHLDHSGGTSGRYMRQQPFHSQQMAHLVGGSGGFDPALDPTATPRRHSSASAPALHYVASAAPGPLTGWSCGGSLGAGQPHDLQDYAGIDLSSVVGGLGLSDPAVRRLAGGSATTRPLYAHDGAPGTSLHGVPSPLAGMRHEQALLMGHMRRPFGMPGVTVGGAPFPGQVHSQPPAPLATTSAPEPPRPALNPQRLFVVVNKAVTPDSLARLFRRFPGMEYCDLKKDTATGKSKGYAYVNYSTPRAAAAAVEQLHGSEFPTGHRIKVMFAEPLGSRQGGRSSGSKVTAEAEGSSDSRASAHSRSRAVEDPAAVRSCHAEVVSVKKAPPPELNHVQDSLSALCTSPDGDDPLSEGHSGGAVDGVASKRQTGEAERQAREGGRPLRGWGTVAQLASSSDSPEGQVYTFLEKPLPDYAIKHVFSAHGEIASVTVHADDPRYALIRYAALDSAIQALQALDGTDLFGIPLSVMASDPLQASRTPKRARVAQ